MVIVAPEMFSGKVLDLRCRVRRFSGLGVNMETIKDLIVPVLFILALGLSFAGCQAGKYYGTKYVFCGGQDPVYMGKLGYVCPEGVK